MGQVALRPVRPSGWAFQLPALNYYLFCLSRKWPWVLIIPVLVGIQFTRIPPSHAQFPFSDHTPSYEPAAALEPQPSHAGHRWEGSAQGIAYSQFNHRFAGLCTLLIGLSELGRTLRFLPPVWARLVLSGAFGAVGVFLLVWSDHEAWPIGSLSFIQTFSGQDQEILLHKLYGVFATTVTISEFIRGIGWVRHPAWGVPLLLYVVIGGATLFVHSHGTHQGVHAIELHHAIMGATAVSAGASKFVGEWLTGSSNRSVRRWELVWVGHIFLIGAQLLLFFE